MIETEVRNLTEKIEIRVAVVASFAGVSKSTCYEWQTRKGVETKHNHDTPKLNWYTLEEKKAVVSYVLGLSPNNCTT